MRRAYRLLPLPLCIAAALPLQAADKYPMDWSRCPIREPIPAFDTQPTGDGTKTERKALPTTVEGDQQTGNVEVPVFNGNVNLNRGNQYLHSDQLTYDKNNSTYVAEGDVRYQDEKLRILAQHAEGNQESDTHTIRDLKYQLVSRRGNGIADHIDLTGDQGKLYGATYSTCPPEARHWEVRARRIDVNTDSGMAVAHDAQLRIGKVPVLYIPWFAFPVDERRRTGLLFPSLSTTGRNGFDYKQPIYLNLAPNYDLTLSPRIMSKRGALLGAEFRYLDATGAGTVAGNWMPHDKLRDRSRGSFVYNAFQNVSQHWQARTGLMWLSDPRYFEDFNNSAAGIAAYSAYSYAGLYGRGRYWDAGVMADHYELADYTLTKASLPYDRLPRLYFNWEQPFGTVLRAGVESEAVRFSHSSWRGLDPVTFNSIGPSHPIPGGSRVDLKPYVTMPIEGNAWFVRPTLAWRYTTYQLDGALADNIAQARAATFAAASGTAVTPTMVAGFRNTKPTRSVPIFSVDAGMYFDRTFVFKGDDYLQTLEPRVYYLKVPYRNQDGLPNFDTSPLTYSWGQLFRDNRYSSADRQSDANQVTVALTTRINRESDGHEKFAASIGQIHYLDDVRVTLPGEPRIEKGASAWVLDADWSPTDAWKFGGSYQWDPKRKQKELASVRARYLFGDGGIVNLSYRYRRALLEQADLSFVYPINDAWSVVGRHYYSLLDHKPLETIAGLQWDSCCIAFRVVARRYVSNRQGDLHNGIMFEFELKGLGSAGQDTRRTLRRAILGYYRDDLYLVPPETATGQTVSDPDPTP